MAIGFVAAGTLYSDSVSGTTITLNKPAGAATGHLLIAFVTVAGDATISVPTGWSLRDSRTRVDGSFAVSNYVLVRDADTADPASWNTTISAASDRRTAQVLAYSGVALAQSQFLGDSATLDPSNSPLYRTTPTIYNGQVGAWRVSFFAAIDDGVQTTTPTWSTNDGVERFDSHIGGTTSPTLTVAAYDSNGAIGLGNTNHTATWSPGGTSSELDLTVAWAGVLAPLVAAPNPKPSYQSLLDPLAGGESIDYDESQDRGVEDLLIEDNAVLEFTQGEEIVLEEGAISVIEDFRVVFNESRKAPGFIVYLNGLQESDQNFHTVEVWRRDPTGRYTDQKVRGLAEVVVNSNSLTVVDYEAPLSTTLHYFLRLYSNEGFFDFGPILPQPQPYIPTLNDAYAGGTAFLKAVDAPELSVPLAVETMEDWSRAGRVKGAYDVLGRRNPVVITDVLGGREGSFSGHCILNWGQSIRDIENVLSPGTTLFFQNHNATMSGIDDFYLKVNSASFKRRTLMTPHGQQENPTNPEMVVTFEVDYVEVDRPAVTGVVVPFNTWQVVYDSYTSWTHVHSVHQDWLSVLLHPHSTNTVIKIFTNSGAWLCPQGVTTVTVECWGGGGAGGITSGTNSSKGGGGGAYARSVLSVTPGTYYPVVVAPTQSPKPLATTAGSSSFNTSQVVAVGGRSGRDGGVGGEGGLSTDCVGSVRFSGGNGGNIQTNTTAGGGGGGGAGPGGAGSSGSSGSGGVGGNGGNAGTGGTGKGGKGGNTGANAAKGFAPGGAGGGRGGGNTTAVSGSGARGEVRITYDI